MKKTKLGVLQLIASSPNGINDQKIADQMGISLDESRFHLGDLDRGGFIKLISTDTCMSPESCFALRVTPQGKMVLEGKIPFEDGLNVRPNSQVFKITNHGSVAAQQFGNNNIANVNQNVSPEITEILQIIDALRQNVSNLPPEKQTIAIEAIDDIEEEVKTPFRLSRIRGGLLALWSVTKDVASFANAITALAQRVGMDNLLS